MNKVRTGAQRANALYLGKSTLFKIFLLAGVILLSALFIWYTFNVIDVLQQDTRTQVEKYVKLWQLAANSNMSGAELQFIFDEIIVKANFPIVVLDDQRNPIHSRNIEGVEQGDFSEETIAYLKQVAEEMVLDHDEFPLVYYHDEDTFVNYFCYGDSKVINQLKIMPFIEVVLVFAFLIVALIGFQNIRRSEERHIWVGMAKETAHQLGTPISSLMGWLEVMESERDSGGLKSEDKALLDDTFSNMKIDIVRLSKIANRFGKIGSIPELEPCDINSLIQEVVDYYCRRLPFEGKGTSITFTADNTVPPVMLNPELFGWTIENMVKNSLQAVDPKEGQIELKTSLLASNRWVLIELKDNGTGIPAAAGRKIFNAGFTTKKRGWGFGLTLVKRIIEDYHPGKVYLKKSQPGETIFEIQLPVENKKES